ncbi:MlaD family protein [Nocardia cyriacigeorgica]|uniref:MlaD family protein n=2 Tax=Nocardia cyriacigeorgica TaxID=135487 RepID=UPI0018F884A9|nr:MlaD family protein [Nocardia cyriacigeorgica]
MPKYGMPGVAADRTRALTVGAAIVGVIVAVLLATVCYRTLRSEDGLRIALQTEQIGDGVIAGTQVRVDGVLVGEVAEIAPDARGTQRITLELDESRLAGLDDSLKVDYAPANLFGVSELELLPGSGGSPLRADMVIDLTGDRAADVYDATMGSLLRGMSQVGATVFTPQMATVIAQAAADVEAFTPLAQALIAAARTVADNQSMPSSELAGRLGGAFDGGGKFAGATIEVIDQFVEIDVLNTDREHLDSGVAALTGQILPALATTLTEAGQLSGYTDMLAPMLTVLARTVSTPQQSAADLRALLTRLGAAMKDTPDGPVLDLELDLRGVPGIAVPLLGLPAKGGAR